MVYRFGKYNNNRRCSYRNIVLTHNNFLTMALFVTITYTTSIILLLSIYIYVHTLFKSRNQLIDQLIRINRPFQIDCFVIRTEFHAARCLLPSWFIIINTVDTANVYRLKLKSIRYSLWSMIIRNQELRFYKQYRPINYHTYYHGSMKEEYPWQHQRR